MRRHAVTALVFALVVTLVGACGDDEADRPALGPWSEEWTALRDLVPTAEQVEDRGTEICGDFLGEVRTRRAEVIPTPDESLEQPVTDWVSDAETLGLDCEREGDLGERLAALREHAGEIDSRIDLLDP